MLIGIEVPVRGTEAVAFYSQGPQGQLQPLTVQAAAKGLFLHAQIVFDVVPVPGPLDCTSRELEHLESHEQIIISTEAIA